MASLLLVALGLAILVAGGEATLRGAIGLSRRFGLSPEIVGLSVVGFGTSLPELVVGVQSTLDGRPGFAVGNAIGSNIANSLLILGAAAMVRPLLCEPRSLRRDGAAMFGATVLCVVLGLSGGISAWEGIVMLGLMVAFVVWSYRQDRKWAGLAAVLHEKKAEAIVAVPASLAAGLVSLASGFGGLVLGASLLVDGAAAIAKHLGVPDSILGLTVVAVGTSLPELAASVVAAWRGHTDVAVGNIIGSNIFNILGILGASSLFGRLPFGADIRHYDIWVLLASTMILFPILITDWRISRREGALLLTCYCAYIASLVWRMIQYGGAASS
jgi:cation:H+ antiporter